MKTVGNCDIDRVERVYCFLVMLQHAKNGLVNFFYIFLFSCRIIFLQASVFSKHVTIRDFNTPPPPSIKQHQKQHQYSDLLRHCVFTDNDQSVQ
jgi:hypothetical protein